MTSSSATAFDILNDPDDNAVESALADLPPDPPAGTLELLDADEGTDDILGGEATVGDQEIIENRPLLDFGGDLPDITDDGVDTDYGDDVPGITEIMGDATPSVPTEDPDEGTADILGDDDNDQEIIENHPILNFGGDIPDITDGVDPDYGDDTPGINEIMGGEVPADVAFDAELAAPASDVDAHALLDDAANEVVTEAAAVESTLADVPDLPPEGTLDLLDASEPEDGVDSVLGDDEGSEIVENRPHLNFGGDLPDYSPEDEEPDFGDDVPGINEITGGDIPADVAFDNAMALDGVAETVDDEDEGRTEVGRVIAPSRHYEKVEEVAARPLVLERKVPQKARDWDLSFGPISAPAGNQTTITISPQCLFRGEKVMATDSAEPAGHGTRIVQIAIGQKIQKTGGDRGTLTHFFSQNALANGVLFDTAHPWSNISVTVSFVRAVTFNMSVFGRAITEID